MLFTPLKTKHKLFCLKTWVTPSSKHISSQLYKPISLCSTGQKSLFLLR